MIHPSEYVEWLAEYIPVEVRVSAVIGVVFVLALCVWVLFGIHQGSKLTRLDPLPYSPPDKRLSGYAREDNLRSSFHYKKRESQWVHWYPVSGDKTTVFGIDHLGRVWRVHYVRGMFDIWTGWEATVSKSFIMTVDDRRYGLYKTRRKAKDAVVAVLMAE